ncbi:MAG: 1-deoxy-D-xylulose-5-phosphate reductoisomerase [Desulfamplus sp.]|nr:1-deoxy-D-xylulose-5-phosphate reductoisomerase [Desulfamplus sp.]
MKRLSILGSTGSIGRNALKIVAMYPDRFKIKALAAGNNVNLLAEQIRTFNPEVAVVLNEKKADELKSILQAKSKIEASNTGIEIYWGDEGYKLAASHKSVDAVLLAMVGAAGLMPALAAIDAQKQIALANKETLVMAGELVMAQAAEKGVKIYPVDSEHSAIFQCIGEKVGQNCCVDRNKVDIDKSNSNNSFNNSNRQNSNYVKKIFLTASGGPFRNTPLEKFKDIKPEHALNHPTWNMGSKITIDSATLMNKALEIVEAVCLFNVPVSDIEVLVHPQSIVHSMVGFNDGSIIAQMGLPDMKSAISYALSYPERLDLKIDFPDFTSLRSPDFAALGHLIFEKPDRSKFPSLDFAVEACKQGGTLPAVMNAANEVAVNAFLNHEIDFPTIFTIIEKTMDMHRNIDKSGKNVQGSEINRVTYTLDDVINADKWAREIANSFI